MKVRSFVDSCSTNVDTLSQESQPATATAIQDCFLAAKPLLFLPNLCVKDQLSTTVTRDKHEQCAHNYAAARCGDLLGNKLATIELYNECREEAAQDEGYREAGLAGLAADTLAECDRFRE